MKRVRIREVQRQLYRVIKDLPVIVTRREVDAFIILPYSDEALQLLEDKGLLSTPSVKKKPSVDLPECQGCLHPENLGKGAVHEGGTRQHPSKGGIDQTKNLLGGYNIT